MPAVNERQFCCLEKSITKTKTLFKYYRQKRIKNGKKCDKIERRKKLKERNISYFKKALVVFMAIVMVFTYMPSGMGVETAWADASVITTAEGFAAMDANGNYVLGGDITIAEPYADEFTGTFDGDGHTVTLDGTTNGVFASTAASAVIQNLGVKGTVSGGETIAGVVGMNAGTIKNCKNAADITSDSRYVGGIAGQNNGTIQSCYNIGRITSSRTRSVNLGGITGSVGTAAIVKNCYNVGNISVVSTSNFAAIAGWINSGGKAENCYYLQTDNLTGTNEYVSGGSKDRATAKTSDEMKSSEFANLLGAAFMSKAGDYPTLRWETPTASVNFNITPANAVLSINDATYTGSCNVALPSGTHSYTVSLDGYTEHSGEVTVKEVGGVLKADPTSVKVTLQKDDAQWTDVHFTVTPDTATFELKDGETTVQPSAESQFTYSVLKSHTYSYTATAEGYEDESGNYCFAEDGKSKTVTLKKVIGISVSGYKTVYTQGEQFDTTGLVVTATLSDNTQKEVSEGYTITGFDSSMPIDSQTITVSYKGKTATFGIKIEEKLFPSHVFDGLKGKATVEYSHNNSYKGKDGEEFIDDTAEGALKSNSAGMDSSQVTVTITLNEDVKASKLYFDYKVSSESFSGYASDGLKINDSYSKIGTTDGFVAYTMSVNGGDKIQLTYAKDYSGDKGSDCVWLKNFRLAELHKLTISTPGIVGATIELKDSDGKTVDSAAGSYMVEDGTYSYTISKFGYETKTGTITVAGGDKTESVTLKELAKKTISFNISLPDGVSGDCTVEIKSDGKQAASGTETSYSLPQGEYTYTITHPNCESAQGSFTIAAEDVTETIQMIRKLVFSDVFAAMSGIEAVNNTDADKATEYGFSPVKTGENVILQSNNKGKGYSIAAMKITAKTAQKLSFSYKVSTEPTYDKFLILLNGTEEINKSGKIDWTGYNIKLSANDSVVLKYTKDSSGDRNDDTVYLKDFSAEKLYKLTFAGAPAGTTFVVKQGETVIEAEADGSYLLTNGNYTYTASAFGYGDANGSITVNDGDVSETISMNKTAAYTVTFNITKPLGITAEAAVAVKSGNTIIAAEDGKYNLPADTYSYTITCEGCETETGEFTVGAEAMTVEVTLEKTLTFGDFFTELNGRADITNDTQNAFKPVKEGAVKYLQSSNKINGTESKITFTFTKPTRMSFDYMVSELGNTSTDSNYGLKIFRNEKLLDRYQEISTEWTSYEVFADAGDEITIAYSCYKNYSGEYIDDENLIKLKNFKAEPLTKISFNITPENAKVSISLGAQNVETINGKFLLEKGSYTYSVKAFGYKDIQRESLTVDGTKDEDTVALTMIPTARVSVSFQTTPTDAVIVVKNEAGETMTALEENASSYSLPANEKYSYEVSADGHVGKSGYFTADAAKTIKVDLVSAGTAWDGTTTKEPTLTNGVYQISSAAELAWFAEKTSKDAGVSAILTANINLNNQTWTSIGSYSTPYTGTFDGNRKTISGLKGTQGLFDTVGASGTIKNLNLAVDISGNGKVGGVCGTLNGRIENTIVSGKIANATSYGATGGIAGTIPKGTATSGRITGCINQAEIQSTYAGYAGTLNIGGIVGYSYGTVENCYNIGSVKAKLPVNLGAKQNEAIGGIAGQLHAGGILKNSYTTGAVTGPETGIGSVIGMNSGTVENTYVLENICAKTIATNYAQTGVSIRKKTAEEMREALFAYTLGAAYNQDNAADSINNGFPVLEWQGGTKPSVPQFEQNALADMDAIVIKDKTRADALEAEKKEYCEFGPDKEFKTEQEALEFWRRFYEDEEGHEKFTWDDIFKKVGIDLTNDGTLSPDASGVYRLPDSCEALILPTSGEKGSTIAWRSDAENITISSGTAVVTRPTGENKTVILTATVTNNNISKDRPFKILLTSAGGAAEETLNKIADRINNSSAFIQPMQMYNHTDIVQAMQQYLDREGYPVKGYVDQQEGIEVSLVSVGTKSMPQDGIDYISEDGTITSYYQGTSGFSTTAAIYNDVHFKLSLDGKEEEVTMHVHVGWDVFHVNDMLDKVLKDITWDAIKGENTNAAEDKMVDGWTHTAVSGTINQNLILPKTLSKYSYAKISWTTVKTEDAQYIYAEDNGDGTATGILQRPPKSDNATPNDKGITLRATATFNFWDDYTVQEMTSQGAATEPAESFKFFDVTIAEGTEEEKAAMKEALVNKYPGLIRDFVNKAQTVDLTKVTSDLQMPRPSILEENGIMSDSYNQHVTMTSSNTDVLQFNGYHAVIYRPLPGEKPETVNYTVTITDRRTKNVLAQKTFEMTILPLTQQEIDDAAAWMKQVCTEDVYWNGIKGENTDKNHITGNLKPFEEILKNADGSTEYIRGAVNITFGGIDVDDLPGYDAMHSQPWRQFRTSYQNVIASETLQVTKPEYDTQVTIDSVFTHTEMSKYWEKFNTNEKYIKFKQFYKQPVSVTVTVKGEKGVNPNPQPTTMSVTVSVDGKNVNGFKSTSGIAISGLSLNATAWDAVSSALTKAGYKYGNFGDYIASVTDANGVTLTETDTANSGWLYTVNGKLPNVYMGSYYLSDNDKIVLYYTADYTKDPAAGAWSGVEVSAVVTDTKAGTTTSPTEVTITEKTTADGTKEKVAEVKVSAENQKEILKQAKANKSKEIILNVSKDAVKDATKADVTLDKSFIDSIVKDTDAKLTIKTPFGDKTYTQDELKAMSEAAVAQTITVAIEKAEEPADDAANIAKAKSIVKDMKLVARSSKTAKKNVKAVLRSDAKVKASIKELKDLGFAVKYRFYRSTKKSASYKSAITKKVASYTNTSGKKGTKYFYKVQVRVYDENGKLIAKTALKQCKYAARTWSK